MKKLYKQPTVVYSILCHFLPGWQARREAIRKSKRFLYQKNEETIFFVRVMLDVEVQKKGEKKKKKKKKNLKRIAFCKLN